MKLRHKGLFLLLLLLQGTAIAAIHPLSDIRQTAMSYLQIKLSKNYPDAEISVGALDPRLRLPQCARPLSGFSPYSGKIISNGTIGVRCEGSKPWSIFVPVKIAVFQDVLVARQPLPRGKIITNSDIQLQAIDISKLLGNHIVNQEIAIGQQLSRPVQMGQVLLSDFLKPPILVKRGQTVPLVAKGGAFEVRMEGEAMADAAAGQRLKVRNIRSKRIVEGKLAKNGIVFVN